MNATWRSDDFVWQIGSGYFGYRDADVRFSLSQLVETVGTRTVRVIEIKLSQGVKLGSGCVCYPLRK